MPLLLFIVALALVTVARLFFGVDFTDESYWIAMALRFARGDRPFVDELFVNQTGSLLFSPFLQAYLYFHGSTEGIVLFTRSLYAIFSFSVAAVVYRSLRSRYPRSVSALAACAAFLILPLNIPNLGYDSLGSGLFTAGIFALLWGIWESRGFPLFLAGICHGLTAFAYPTLIVPVFSVFLLFAVRAKPRLGPTARYAIGGTLVAVTLLPVFLQAGDSLEKGMRYSVTAYHHGGGLPKLLVVFRHMFRENVSSLLGLWIALFTLAFLRFRDRTAWMLFLMPMFLTLAYFSAAFTQMWFVFYFALLAPTAFVLSKKAARELFWLGWIPSWIAAVTIGWTSLSAPINGVLGFVPAFIVGSLFVYETLPVSRLKSAFLPMLCLSLAVQQFSGKAFYRDGNIGSLNARIPDGPYRGIFTTPHKLRYLEKITRDIHRVENRNGRIVFYEFPAGYLISTMKIGSNSAWMRDVSQGKRFYLDYYQDGLTLDDRVFEVHWLTHEREKSQWIRYGDGDPFHRFLKETHEPILRREDYTVLAPKAG